jgi:hypothetical protein
VTNNDKVSGIRAGGGDAAAAQEVLVGIDAVLVAARLAMEEDRCGDALRHVQAAFARVVADDCDPRSSDFGPMFAWEVLASRYMPARAALAQARDAQAHRLLAGELSYGPPRSEFLGARSRFALVVRMNEILNDAQSTYELFVQLAARLPEQARHMAFIALPAIVEAGDFELGERFMPDPVGFLPHLNETARTWLLFPTTRSAPRVGAELSNFAGDLPLRCAILRGLGRGEEADALNLSALAGLATDEMRDWVQRDLAAPGAIIRAISEHQMAQDEAARQHIPDQ